MKLDSARVLAVGFAGTSSLFLESAKTMRESQGVVARWRSTGLSEWSISGRLVTTPSNRILPSVAVGPRRRPCSMCGYRQGFSGKSSNQ